MSTLYRPGIILPVPEWINRTIERNNLRLSDLVDYGKMKEYLSGDELLLIPRLSKLFNKQDNDFSFIDYQEVWEGHQQLLPMKQDSVLETSIIDRLSFDQEEWDALYHKDELNQAFLKYYDIKVVPIGQQFFYAIELRKGFINAIKDKSYRDKYFRELYQVLSKYETNMDLYDWHLPIANRYLEVIV